MPPYSETPYSEIQSKIEQGHFPGKPTDGGDVLRLFRSTIRSCYDHNSERTRDIFNQAFALGKDSWRSLAAAYQNITDRDFPDTVPDAESSVREVIMMADSLLSSRDFLSKPKDVRRKEFGSWLKERITGCHSRIRERVREDVVRHYEKKFGTSLTEVIEDEPVVEPVYTPPVNPPDVITVDVPLFIRLMEFAREDARNDVALHRLATNITKLSSTGRVLGMEDYQAIIHEVNGRELDYLRTLAGIKK